MKERILVVEDDPSIIIGLEDNLAQAGFEVLTASDGATATRTFESTRPDLVLLDIMLPDTNGYSLCKEFKVKDSMVPIIMLTSKSEEIDKVLGLEIGADDYVTKPFSVRELIARINAIMRRYKTSYSSGSADVLSSFEIGKVRIDFDRFEAFKGSKRVKLTKLEFEILKYLIKNRGRVVSREELLNSIWGYESFPSTRTIDNFIARLRKLIEEKPSKPKYLISVRGVGYRLVDEDDIE